MEARFEMFLKRTRKLRFCMISEYHLPGLDDEVPMCRLVAGHFGKQVVGEGAGEYLLAEIRCWVLFPFITFQSP